MKFHKFINFLLLATLMSCATIGLSNLNLMPKFEGVDPEFTWYANEWLFLSKTHNISFKNKVSIGFDRINIQGAVGICTFGVGFREISIDPTYWRDATPIRKMLVVYHEMGHCYCDKKHEFAPGKPYGEDESKNRSDPAQKDGFFEDSCPISIMYPYVLEEYCFKNHYSEYINELFKNCDPY